MSDERALDVLHLDMDCFFAAVEAIDHPELLGEPVIVGGLSDRGVVASASYEARAFGVHAAMPTAIARRCCPHGRFVAPSHGRYGEMNRRLLEIIERVTPEYEPIALDEAFIDVRGAHRLFGESQEIAGLLRGSVRAELGLECSVGVARTKLLAKLASKAAKPRVRLSDEKPPRPIVEPGAGVRVVDPEEEVTFLYSHPLRALPGIGPKTMAKLSSFGILTIADAAEVGRDRLSRLLGETHGGVIAAFIDGVDSRRVTSERDARSIGNETTFPRDLYDPEEVSSRIRELAGSSASRARSAGTHARTVSLKVRFRDLSVITRARTFDHPVAGTIEIANAAVSLLEGVACERGIRLVGVHLSNFVDADVLGARQLALFGEEGSREEADHRRPRAGLDEATDEIRRRFGENALDALSVMSRRNHRRGPSDGNQGDGNERNGDQGDVDQTGARPATS